MRKSIQLINDERTRQIEAEGWTPEHDDKHVCGELSDAAICYAARQYWKNRPQCFDRGMIWPFDEAWWKPAEFSQDSYTSDRIKELAKAGALIAAEIDRLLRLQERQG